MQRLRCSQARARRGVPPVRNDDVGQRRNSDHTYQKAESQKARRTYSQGFLSIPREFHASTPRLHTMYRKMEASIQECKTTNPTTAPPTGPSPGSTPRAPATRGAAIPEVTHKADPELYKSLLKELPQALTPPKTPPIPAISFTL
ncbi:ORF3 [torque teno Delphinidae virus 2]